MLALLETVSETVTVLAQYVLFQQAAFQETCKNSFNAALDFLCIQLSKLFATTLPSVEQHLTQRLQLDPFSIEDLLIPSMIALAAVVSLLFSLLLDYWTLCSPTLPVTSNHASLAPIHALISVITPTYSRWPPYYLSVARRALSRHDARLRLSLSKLVDDILSGAIELRSPESDLPDLIADTLQSQGWRINLIVESSWHAELMVRITGAHLACILPNRRVKLAAGSQRANPKETTLPEKFPRAVVNGEVLYSDPAHFALRSHHGHNILMLDAVPYSQLSAYIRSFQSSLTPGTSAMLGFSTLGSSVRSNSDQFVFASIPFLPRKHLKKSASSPELPQSARRSVLPLLVSLNQVLKLLTSGSSPFVVESVQNVSDRYAEFLRDYVQDLTCRPSTRERFVCQWGMDGWREELFLANWEAALFSTSILSRWLILVHQ